MSKQIYLNKKQFRFIQALMSGLYKLFVIIAGRGFGKSTLIAEYLYRCVDTMPRSRGWLGSATMDIIENRTLSAVQAHWERMGLIEDVDYVIGKKPPPHFERAFHPPRDYKNCIAWANGTVIDIVSLYSKNMGRGANYQFGAGDEFALVDRETYNKNLMPTMRGCYHEIARLLVEEYFDPPYGRMEEKGLEWEWIIPFKDNPLYCSIFLASSMPWLDSGKWLLQYEHSEETFYMEATAEDNLEVVGPDYVPNQKKALTDLEFRIEIKNERMDQLPDGFYPIFKDSIHTTFDEYYNSSLPLDLSFDFGGRFNCMSVWQSTHQIAYCDASLYAHGIVDEVVDIFIDRYAGHANKVVYIYGDRNGNNSRSNNKTTLYEDIIAKLTAAGWRCVLEVEGLDPPHADKFVMISNMMSNKLNSGLPKILIHRERGKALIISIKGAPIKDDFKKDKRSEHPDNPTPDEHATHLSDTLDNYVYPKFRHMSTILNVDGGEIYIG